MKKALSTLLAALMFTSLFAITAVANEGNVDTGQRLYQRMMLDHTNLDSNQFAQRHTMDEWRDLMADGGEKFIEKYSSEFPGLGEYLKGDLFPRHLAHLRAFVIHYASDSGNFASCAG